MEELIALGYFLSFSEACPVVSWGKWHVSFKHHLNGAYVKGYGDTEAEAVSQALETLKKSLTK